MCHRLWLAAEKQLKYFQAFVDVFNRGQQWAVMSAHIHEEESFNHRYSPTNVGHELTQLRPPTTFTGAYPYPLTIHAHGGGGVM